MGGRGGRNKHVLCKPAWCEGLRLVGVFFERWQKGGMMVAEVANCHLFMYTLSCVIRNRGAGNERQQTLTNNR